jgi:hypothetical protein
MLVAAALLSGCQATGTRPPKAVVEVGADEPEQAWAGIIDAADRDRLNRLPAAWEQAIAGSRGVANGRRLRAEGPLLDPAAALPRPALPPGSYRCRLHRFTAPGRGRGGLVSSGPFFCFVGAEGANTSFTRQTGPDRPGGYLYDNTEMRQIFIGATAQGREQVPPAYGQEAQRNVAGVVERVGSFRYRLVVPWPRSGDILEVYELIPAP